MVEKGNSSSSFKQEVATEQRDKICRGLRKH
jgi:hypothetical protein